MASETGRPIDRRSLIAAGGSALVAPGIAQAAAQQTSAHAVAAGGDALTPQQFYQPTDPDWQNAFERLIDASRRLAGAPDRTYNPQAPRTLIPSVSFKYLLHETLHLQGAGFDWEGASKGRDTSGGSVLKWTRDVTGIVIHRHDSVGEAGTGAAQFGADGTRLKGLLLEGSAARMDAARGVVLRAPATLEEITVRGFSGNGFHWHANEGAAPVGNANHAQASQLAAMHNWGNGFFAAGDNANAMLLRGLNAESNGRWGICDISTVGNFYEGGHLSSNGFFHPEARTTSVVWHNHGGVGRFYHAVPDVPSAALAATEPGTNAAVWGYLRDSSGPSPTFPRWVRGGGGTTYVEGGAEKLKNAGHVHDFPYNEGGLMAIYSPAKLRNGSLNNVMEGLGGVVEFSAQGQNLFNAPVGASVSRGGRTISSIVGGNAGDGQTRSMNDSADRGTSWIERLAGGVLSLARGPMRVWQVLTDGGFHPSLLYVGTPDGNRKARLFRSDGMPDPGLGEQGDLAIALSFARGEPYMWGKQGSDWVVLARAP